MSFYNHITTVEIAERGALSAMPIGTAAPLHMHEALLPGDVCPQSETFSKPIYIVNYHKFTIECKSNNLSLSA